MQTDGEPVREIVRQRIRTSRISNRRDGHPRLSDKASSAGGRGCLFCRLYQPTDKPSLIPTFTLPADRPTEKKHSASIFTSLIQDSSHKTSLTVPPPFR